MTPIPDTPNRTPEEIVANVLAGVDTGVGPTEAEDWEGTAAQITARLRAAGLLVIAPTEAKQNEAKRSQGFCFTEEQIERSGLKLRIAHEVDEDGRYWFAYVYARDRATVDRLVALARSGVHHVAYANSYAEAAQLGVSMLDEIEAALTAAAGVAPQEPSATVDDHDFRPVAGHPDDDECTHRSDGTDLTYCGEPRSAHEAPISQESSARVVTRGLDTDCASGFCHGACTHLMWACERCSSEGGWGAPRDLLEQWAADHVCPAPPAPSSDREKRWTLRPSRDDGYELAWFDGKRTEGWWLSAEQVDALRPALAAVPDETELAEVIWWEQESRVRDGFVIHTPETARSTARAVREWWEKKR